MGLKTLETDPLFCQEHSWDIDADIVSGNASLALPETMSEEWQDVLSTLYANESSTRVTVLHGYPTSAIYLYSGRRGAAAWVARACDVHGFNAVTAMLAVGYLDRCFVNGGLRLQAEMPWMERLSAVACLSLAAKVEETRVPLLVDLQAMVVIDGEREYLFEAKTVRRMELLVLSTLGWRMSAVTPMSFVDHVLQMVLDVDDAGGGGGARVTEVVRICEGILMNVVTDWRWVRFPASVWAAAVLLHAMQVPLEDGDGESSENGESQHVLALLNLNKERVEGCYKLISEILGVNNRGFKRKLDYSDDYHPSPSSPSEVLNSCFSYDSSCDSWATTWPSSVSSSPDPPPHPFKRFNFGNSNEQ